ncbi:hypothetical protein [Loigolactobacillus bifermentans]|jgi:hypothetical protein|uniref:Knr4/Smi1-like domain-containing protein n=1 Tax=Loigolactobacillus bifermentans DSM 20003 TaxID=1423726 RepID=A0A0R1H6C1_9LACO|nr:hypothetical protein [Loigolactobacillus bifermentans]KRK40131.1 hypothetical protein FC07_GL001332 [Loigolactobacillus bifermentans DSM 20003]QGG60879.1 hypothetical protein LB003_10615 [Loigolactobacillus bifermentans]
MTATAITAFYQQICQFIQSDKLLYQYNLSGGFYPTTFQVTTGITTQQAQQLAEQHYPADLITLLKLSNGLRLMCWPDDPTLYAAELLSFDQLQQLNAPHPLIKSSELAFLYLQDLGPVACDWQRSDAETLALICPSGLELRASLTDFLNHFLNYGGYIPGGDIE